MIYAIHKVTKEHRRVTGAWPAYTGREWRTVPADSDGWIPWPSGECPLPDGAQCLYRMRAHGDSASFSGVENLVWNHSGRATDIIAYRPILDTKPEAPEWDGEGLPPIGVECEVMHCDEWRRCDIIAHFKQRANMVAAVTVGTEDGQKVLDAYDSKCFRPLRSDEDRAVEAIEAAQKRGDKIGGRPAGFREIYRAIRAGDVPGVTATD